MTSIYIIRGLNLSFPTYNEAEHFRREYNHKYYPDCIEPQAIKWYRFFNTCAEAFHWGRTVEDDRRTKNE